MLYQVYNILDVGEPGPVGVRSNSWAERRLLSSTQLDKSDEQQTRQFRRVWLREVSSLAGAEHLATKGAIAMAWTPLRSASTMAATTSTDMKVQLARNRESDRRISGFICSLPPAKIRIRERR